MPSPIAQHLIQQQLEERMLYRRRLIENGRKWLDEGDLASALGHVFMVLDQIQQNDESVIQLHRECLAMVEHAGKALSLVEMMKPTVIKVG